MAPTMFSPAGTSNEKMNTGIEGEIHAAMADLTRRLQQLHTLHTPDDDNNQEAEKNHEAGQVAEEGPGVRIITLAGQNSGATMNLPAGSTKNIIDSTGEGGQQESVIIRSKHTTINIYINNNVQGVNNSILFNSSCELRDPGVRLDVTTTSEIDSCHSEISHGEEKGAGSNSRAAAVTTLSNYTTTGRKRPLAEFLNSGGVDADDPAASCVESAVARSTDEWRPSTPSPDIYDPSKAGSEEGGSAHSEFRASNNTEFMKPSGSDQAKPSKARFLLIRKLLICSSSRNSRVAE